jgi:hypothetical protein
MRRKYIQRCNHSERDHAIASITRITLGVVGVLVGLLAVRSLPDLIRYVKMERM